MLLFEITQSTSDGFPRTADQLSHFFKRQSQFQPDRAVHRRAGICFDSGYGTAPALLPELFESSCLEGWRSSTCRERGFRRALQVSVIGDAMTRGKLLHLRRTVLRVGHQEIIASCH